MVTKFPKLIFSGKKRHCFAHRQIISAPIGMVFGIGPVSGRSNFRHPKAFHIVCPSSTWERTQVVGQIAVSGELWHSQKATRKDPDPIPNLAFQVELRLSGGEAMKHIKQ